MMAAQADMVQHKNIGVLGAGNMAQALIRGWLAAGISEASRIRASDVDTSRRQDVEKRFGITTSADNGVIASWADVVVLALKPQSVGTALSACGDGFKPAPLLISVAAGVSTSALEAALPERVRVLRAMPNTPALVLAGATAITKGSRSTDDDVILATALFDAVGKTVILPETQMNAVTGLSGSGPGYVLLMIEALADGGVLAGLSRETAQLLAAQTVLGTARLLLETGEHPARLKDLVTSPGGTTIHGLRALESAGTRNAFMDAVQLATARADELGKKR